jgi:exo-1,4-beta-D-glucosaminidase
LLAILWENNCLSLLPGEKREVSATFHDADLKGAKPVVVVDGWNVTPSVRIGVDDR